MRHNIEIYRIWAPDDSIWANWAKPVLFMHMPYNEDFVLLVPKTTFIETEDCHTMIIVDLPGEKGVEESIALARLGYRPVPLYNGVYCVDGVPMIVPVNNIVAALKLGAETLVKYSIRPDAPPVFMLDSNRMEGFGKQPGMFDNRWCVFPQDMPSASFLIDNKIDKIIVHSEFIQNDLAHILRRYHEKGIKIYQRKDNESPKEINVVKPSAFRSFSYRFKKIFGLVRNAAGGFGGTIPEPVETTGSGYRLG